jgi:hypothetical protein
LDPEMGERKPYPIMAIRHMSSTLAGAALTANTDCASERAGLHSLLFLRLKVLGQEMGRVRLF